MKRKILYPYSLEKKEDAIRLTIGGRKRIIHIVYLFVAFQTTILLGLSVIIPIKLDTLFLDTILFQGSHYIVFLSLAVVFLLIIYFTLDGYCWKRKGVEIFIIYSDRLEYYQKNKPFKSTKKIIYFQQIKIGCQSGKEFYSEEEAKELGVELNLDKVRGNHPIQFYMNDGENIIDSEREMPIDVIRKIKKEYNLIKEL